MFTRILVHWDVCMVAYHTYVPMYQNTCEHVRLIDSNTKFDLSSRIINRFQRFLMFWKAEDLLFHLKITVCTNCKFFAEKNNFSYKNVQLFLKFASLNIWDLGKLTTKNREKCILHVFREPKSLDMVALLLLIKGHLHISKITMVAHFKKLILGISPLTKEGSRSG